MGRGSMGTVRQATALSARQEQAANAAQGPQQEAGKEFTGAANDLGTTASGIDPSSYSFSPDQQASFGYTPEGAANLESMATGAAAEPFAGASQAISRGVARTRNAGGAAGAIEAAARDRSTAAGNAGLQARGMVEQARQGAALTTAQQNANAQLQAQQMKNQLVGQKATLLGQKYGINTNLLQGLSGLPTNSLGVAGSASGSPQSLGPLGSWS